MRALPLRCAPFVAGRRSARTLGISSFRELPVRRRKTRRLAPGPLGRSLIGVNGIASDGSGGAGARQGDPFADSALRQYSRP